MKIEDSFKFSDAYAIVQEKIGSNDSIKKYLDTFRSYAPSQFAIIKIGGESIEDPSSLKEIAISLSCLSSLGLYPIVIHGANPQIDAAYRTMGILKPEKINGIRPTTKEGLRAVEHGFADAHGKLYTAICDNDGKVKSMHNEHIFRAKKLIIPGKKLGYVGEVTGIDREPIEDAISEGKIPLSWTLGYSDDGQVYNINSDHTLPYLVDEFGPRKLILVNERGGVLDENGQIISEIDIAGIEYLQKTSVVNGGMGIKTSIAADIKRKHPDIMIEVAASKYLLHELFTDEGHGTLIRR
ncbi:MAG: hypothetical protein HZB67_02925 [Candidatus Aenigmarchaeota archaeon]|nr:hypothetical protein [Candidatus Aenigmarchaeota archaeon]